MQRLAREMNFSESTFILPAERPDTDIRMRIFTPLQRDADGGTSDDRQHVRAGADRCHPARARRDSCSVSTSGRCRSISNGLTSALRFRVDDAVDTRRSGRSSTQRAACRRRARAAKPTTSRTTASAGSVVRRARICSCRCATTRPSIARSRDAAGVPAPGKAMTGSICRSSCSRSTVGGRRPLYSRMFAPEFGIIEDPATGSASGPLGCYLVHHGVVAG